MTKDEIKYIESDLEGILATQATLLKFGLEMIDKKIKGDDSKERTEHVINTLMYLHKNYKLSPKRS